MPKQTINEIARVVAVNTFSFTTITFSDIENGMKVIMFLITVGFTIDKWIEHRKQKERGVHSKNTSKRDRKKESRGQG